MYRFAILSVVIGLQLISVAHSDTSDANPNSQSRVLIQTPSTSDDKAYFNDGSESDEEYAYVPRSASFLRFGRQSPPSSASFLRFGRSNPGFLRFGRSGQSGGSFLRFGRQTPEKVSNNFLRSGKKAEFLRFG